MIAFGPIASRRLGASLGVNNIPAKHCGYSCVYCQAGETSHLEIRRTAFYSVTEIVRAVEERLAKLRERGEPVERISFVADGEPTLDANLGAEIAGLKQFGLPVAVLTNACILWMADVRNDLLAADLVSLKVDAAGEAVWRKINRPPAELSFEQIREGMRVFAGQFKGTLLTETLLVRDINDGGEEVRKIAVLIKNLVPKTAYLGIPTRPPAQSWVIPPPEDRLLRAFAVFTETGLPAELLTGRGGLSFGYTGALEDDLVAAAAVHPMSREQVTDMVKRAGKEWAVVEDLVRRGRLKEIEYQGTTYYGVFPLHKHQPGV